MLTLRVATERGVMQEDGYEGGGGGVGCAGGGGGGGGGGAGTVGPFTREWDRCVCGVLSRVCSFLAARRFEHLLPLDSSRQ